ncbi:MAG: hypothetical protein ACLFSB_02290 [Chitinispirillaceae bacterium]
MRKTAVVFALLLLIATGMSSSHAQALNAFNQKTYTIESRHFRIHYNSGLHHVAKEVGDILEELYDLYRNSYHITLPSKTEVLLSDDDKSGGWALAIQNTIAIWANDLDWNLRGTSDQLRNVVAHEYAHIVSIAASFKMPPWMPYVQFGFFSHPNNIASDSSYGGSLDAFHLFPSEILPPWIFEGIAQYESMLHKGDRWDSHRDMILRTLSLSGSLNSWDHMSVFSGKEDDYEKTYNHGFSLVKYIAETYGYGKIVALLRESSKLGRVNFDRGIKATLGISGRQLYKEWSDWLKKQYMAQMKTIGKQVYGRKINKDGFDNFWPRFGPKDEEIYFLSNGKHDFAFSFKMLHAYNRSDTIAEDKRISVVKQGVKGFYDINDSTNRIAFTSMKSPKSRVAPHKGGIQRRDIFIDTLTSKPKGLFARKKERQVTEKQGMFHAVFSPSGDMIAGTQHDRDQFFLCLMDTAGKEIRRVYPDYQIDSLRGIKTIYGIDWSPNGKHIAISYVDTDHRKIGIFDTTTGEFFDLCDTPRDERDPRFGPEGKYLYFSSDRTGVFNIYRYHLETSVLERITNVSGGAFTPDVSHDNKTLVYANYDPDGYGIYQIDSIAAVEQDTLTTKAALVPRNYVKRKDITTTFTPPRPYSKIPTKFMFVPTFFVEQILTDDDNPFKGLSDTKVGGIISINDPLDWMGRGTNAGLYFLTRPIDYTRLIAPDKNSSGIINPEATYDFGMFVNTNLLPIDLSLFYAQRGISGTDYFLNRGDTDESGNPSLGSMKYNLNPSLTELTLSHWFQNSIGIHGIASYNKYNVHVLPEGYKYYSYSPAKGYQLGAAVNFHVRQYDSKMAISPKGMYLELRYDFWDQNLQNEEKSFEIEDGTIKELYDRYVFNQITGSLKYAFPAPWYAKHDIFTEFTGTALKLTDGSVERLKEKVDEGLLYNAELPSYFKPGDILPGYVYYYRDTSIYHTEVGDSAGVYKTEVPTDTVLLSGNGIITAKLSYRFPLFPGSINRKLGFLYFDRLYGALNAGAGTAKDNLDDFLDLSADDFLFYIGAELRLEAISFNSYPLAIDFRWDRGISKPAPIGGDKFSLSVGFEFDDWGVILQPDGRNPKTGFSFPGRSVSIR